MHGNEERAMTKRIKSSDLVRARKETKRLQREAQTRIRKATKRAKNAGDTIQLKKIEQLQKTHANSLASINKSGLPKSFRNNVMREKGRAMQLKKLNQSSILSKKKQKRQTRKTFEKLFGKEKTKSLLSTIGGSQMSRMSSEFWDQMYKAQDMLFSIGIVPADEIMGKYGSIGSGLLDTGKQLVNDGFWESLELDVEDNDNNGSYVHTDLVLKKDDKKIKTSELSNAIVEWYKQKYGLNSSYTIE